jgi:hypothetical protein
MKAAVNFNRKDRAKRYHKSSIFSRQYSIPACPGWELMLTIECGFVMGMAGVSISFFFPVGIPQKFT